VVTFGVRGVLTVLTLEEEDARRLGVPWNRDGVGMLSDKGRSLQKSYFGSRTIDVRASSRYCA